MGVKNLIVAKTPIYETIEKLKNVSITTLLEAVNRQDFMSFDYTQEISSLSGDDRLHFYELFAHSLTVSIRGVWLDKDISDAEKVERIKLINEILHRVTNKGWMLRLNTHEWTEEDTWQMIDDYISDNENIRSEILFAIKCSLKPVKNNNNK